VINLISLIDIIDTMQGLLGFQHVQTNFTTLETEVNSHGTQINALAPLVGLGGVKESGSNANGYYVKYEDGTMICTGWIKLEYASVAKLTKTWTFPALFAAGNVNSVIGNPSFKNKAGADNYLIGGAQGAITILNSSILLMGSFDATLANIELYVASGLVTGDFIWCSIVAIGRWKA